MKKHEDFELQMGNKIFLKRMFVSQKKSAERWHSKCQKIAIFCLFVNNIIEYVIDQLKLGGKEEKERVWGMLNCRLTVPLKKYKKRQ